MVVRKYRYIAFQYFIDNEYPINLETSVLSIVRDKVNEVYGENVLYRLINLDMLEYLHESNIFVIRVDRDIAKYVIFSMLSSGRINDMKCKFALVLVSGIYKKLLIRLRKYLLDTSQTEESIKQRSIGT